MVRPKLAGDSEWFDVVVGRERYQQRPERRLICLLKLGHAKNRSWASNGNTEKA